MSARVVVTGIGMMTPAGFGEETVKQTILAGVHQFRDITRFDGSKFRSAIAAQSTFEGTLLDLGRRCMEDAIRSAGLSEIGLAEASLVLGIQGDYDALSRYWKAKMEQEMYDSRIVEFMPSYHLEALSNHYGIAKRGSKMVLNNACIASSNAIGIAFELIKQKRTDRVICGGYSLVTEEMFAKFASGRAFATDGRIRSFSRNRTGMLLGDGGAVLVLESYESAKRRQAPIYAEVAGWGLACDAFHVSQPHPEGAGVRRAIEKALRTSSIDKEQIQYINAHGTGTPYNDKSETCGIKQAFGDTAYRIPVSSTKTMTGHILEGTGVVEAAISIVAMNEGVIPPTVGYEEPDPQCDLDYVPNVPRQQQIDTVMSINASFGGNNTAIILRKLK
ncbi:beta-ketoacyl-[acyl-carrier-protein] synthase family protein [Paenibacillus xylaniclasticus]|uniref:beta-ketoacyl-[acyl-carrier-protein] synthase family protein n=1 Tax=Paenibacillus xylaniclasticus TaxID=588083 RepID=UPI000FDB3BFB|nr:beta-ketoacyl-[acyl-carrier-protein] synthase family protein [Paenibacillus xylaniclasticus]